MRTARILLLFVFFLTLSSCVSTQGRNAFAPLPKAFLGWWEPGNGTCLAIFLHADGRIEDICNKDKKLISVRHYKVIHIAGPKDVYLAIYEPGKENYLDIGKDDTYEYLHIKVKRDEIATQYDVLDWDADGPELTAEEWNHATATQMWKSYQKSAFFSSNGHYYRLNGSPPPW